MRSPISPPTDQNEVSQNFDTQKMTILANDEENLLKPKQSKSYTFSQQMLRYLLQSGFNKTSLAKELHVSVSTLNRIVRGVIGHPANKTFSKLLRLYCAVLAKESR